jgi:hypothetical protein
LNFSIIDPAELKKPADLPLRDQMTASGASIWHANDRVNLMLETYRELATAVLAEDEQ